MTETLPTPEQVYVLALARQNAGELEEAEHLYRMLLEHYPDQPDVNHNMGMIQLMMGRKSEAMSYLRTAVAAQPDMPEYYLTMCGALNQMGYMDDALALAREQLARLGEYPRLRAFVDQHESTPWIPWLQGAHAPERQVYMSAVIGKLKHLGRPLAILEIGSFMGASLMTWGRAVERLTDLAATIVCIDPWDGADMAQYDYTGSIEKYLEDGTAHRVFRNTLKFMPDRVNVTELRGMSHEMLPTLQGRTFDLIYVDGCHLHPEVFQDLQACHGLLADGGFVCGDDLEVQLHEIDADFVLANARNDGVMIPGSDDVLFHPGVTLGVGRFLGPVSVYRGFWVMRKTGQGYEPVSMAGEVGVLPYHWPSDYLEHARRTVAEDGLLAQVL
jgi:tetratricopeptide (TPR) repeat protein